MYAACTLSETGTLPYWISVFSYSLAYLYQYGLENVYLCIGCNLALSYLLCCLNCFKLNDQRE